jgi:hypothetical protein
MLTKMQSGISKGREQLGDLNVDDRTTAAQEGLCSMELVLYKFYSKFVFFRNKGDFF